jgi:hypothetical protein
MVCWKEESNLRPTDYELATINHNLLILNINYTAAPNGIVTVDHSCILLIDTKCPQTFVTIYATICDKEHYYERSDQNPRIH